MAAVGPWKIELREMPRRWGDCRPSIAVMLNGAKWGELYWNMRGYRGVLPLPSGRQFDAGEASITKWKRAAAEIMRDARNGVE